MRSFIFITLISLVVLVNAQSISNGVPNEKNYDVIDLLGNASGAFWTVDTDGKRFFLSSYNESYAKISELEIKLPKAEGKKMRFLRAYAIKGKLNILGLSDDEKTKELTIVNYGLGQEGEIGEEYKTIGTVPVEKRDVFSELKIVFSSDSSKILFYHNTPINKGKGVRTSYILCDDSFNPIATGNKLFEKNAEDMFMGKCIVNKHGDFVLQYNLVTMNGTKMEAQQYGYALFDGTGVEIRVHNVQVLDKYYYEGNLAFFGKEEKDIVSVAFFKDLKSFKSNSALTEDDYIHGYLVCQWNVKDLSITKKENNVFGKTDLAFHYDEKTLTKNLEKGKSYWDVSETGMPIINEIILSKNGFTFIGEQENRSNGLIKGAILILQTDGSGKHQWTQKINKSHSHVLTNAGDGMIEYGFDIYYQLEKKQATGYFLSSTNNGVKIAYYDEEGVNYTSYESLKPVSSFSKTVLYTVNVGFNGSLNKSSSKDEHLNGGNLSPSLSKRLDASSFTFICPSKKTYVIGKLVF